MSVKIIWIALWMFLSEQAFGQSDIAGKIDPSFQTKAFNYNGFIKNAGQIRDLKNLPVKSVLYYGQLNDRSVYITNKGISFLFYKIKNIRKQGTARSVKTKKTDSLTKANFELERVDLTLLNAEINENNIETKDASSDALYNFYFDNYSDRGVGLKLKNEILVKNVYPGTDWRISLKQNADSVSFKYEFIVHPGARAEDIKLHYSDNAKFFLDADGGLNIQSRMGFISEKKPYAFTDNDKKPVAASFTADKKNIRFSIEYYDHSKTLVIDPDVFWATYLSSTVITQMYNTVEGADMHTDSSDNIFVQLSANMQTPFPILDPGGGAYYQDFSSVPNGAMILMKFTPTGKLVWSTFFGGSKGITGSRIAVDNRGNLCAAGKFTDIFSTIPLLDNGGFFDAVPKKHFITKFDNQGRLIWSSFFASFETGITDMTSDNKGNFYMTGYSRSYLFPVVNPGGGAYCITNPQYSYAYTFFVSQFNSANQLVWSTRIEGNSDDDLGTRICADNFGNIYLAGAGRSDNYPLVNAGGYFNTSGQVMITKFNGARQMVWSTYYPGSFPYKDVTTDDQGNLYFVSGRWYVKFNALTQLLWENELNFPKLYFLKDIEYDKVNDQLQVLGIMNDAYYGFPTQNATCGGSFYFDGIQETYTNATGPIFLTLSPAGTITYLSLVDWVYEYYDYSSIDVDTKGDVVYLFGNQQNGYYYPNPDLTNPGNGAYFDPLCSRESAFLLKLKWQGLKVDSIVTAPANCTCNGSINLAVILRYSSIYVSMEYRGNDGITEQYLPGKLQCDHYR
ncbi:MAG: SBBP repeat-containing protein [Bacteroidota bacterium]